MKLPSLIRKLIFGCSSPRKKKTYLWHTHFCCCVTRKTALIGLPTSVSHLGNGNNDPCQVCEDELIKGMARAGNLRAKIPQTYAICHIQPSKTIPIGYRKCPFRQGDAPHSDKIHLPLETFPETENTENNIISYKKLCLEFQNLK